jgi:ppGpp synthetase/RelA/SpoT-type nucleotidyltranferase
MDTLEKSLISVADLVGGIDHHSIKKILKSYQDIPEEWRHRTKLIATLTQRYPHIFSTKINGSRSIREQVKKRSKVFNFEKNSGLSMQELLTQSLRNPKIASIRKKLKQLFPTSTYDHAFRIKDPQRLLGNLELDSDWGRSDIVGMRVTPKLATRFPQLVKAIERALGDDLAFKFNLFLRNNKKLARVRTSSEYYFAINYYSELTGFFMEIQIRTASIGLWSDLTHDTMYKRKIRITPTMEKDLTKFGEICNIVDFYYII